MSTELSVTGEPAAAGRRGGSLLGTRLGASILVLLCAVQFLDVVDSSIVNVALPSIQHDLRFSQQSLQWVASGYVLTYGGFLLLGGRAADLLGRRRLLVAGVALFAACSLAGGLATSQTMLIAARLAQGVGAALMAPAALSILTTTFTEDADRHRALGVWGGISGLAAAAGVFFGGVLSQGLGWRWVLFVNLPVCGLVLAGVFRLLPADRPTGTRRRLDALGAVLATGGMLLLVYALIRAPERGWGDRHTVGELATAAVILLAFALNQARGRDPLMPLSVFRVRGLAAADATQMIGFAGFYAMFFFLTLYMQNVLGYSPIKAGAAYLPVTLALGLAATAAPRLFARVGTRTAIVAGSLLAAAAVYYLSRIPVHGNYPANLLPGLVVMAIGLGTVLVGVTAAANAGVPPHQAGLAAALLNTSMQLGIALGLAVFSALATARTNHLLAEHQATPQALTGGYGRALLACAAFLALSALTALRTPDSRGTPARRDP